MPRTLMLMRHAKSDWDAGAASDFERPLNKRGHKAAESMAEFIAKLTDPPQLIVSSPAVRAKTTAEVSASKLNVPLELRDGLYGAGDDGILAVAQQLPPDITSALLVGHNPGIEWLAVILSGDPTVEMKAGTLAVFEFDSEGQWASLTSEHCKLVKLQHPRELDGSD